VTIENIDVLATAEKIKKLLKKEKDISPALHSMIELLLLVVSLLVKRLSKNSRNSSKPPSSDPNREKKKSASGQNKPGGQKGHVGKNLSKAITPDETIEHKITKCVECDNSIANQ